MVLKKFNVGEEKNDQSILCIQRIFNQGFLIPPHPLTNFEIQKYYQNEARFNGIYSRDNLPNKIKYGAYVINLDEYSDIGTHWIALRLLTLIVLELNTFQKLLRNSLVIKTYKNIFLEYKHVIQ